MSRPDSLVLYPKRPRLDQPTAQSSQPRSKAGRFTAGCKGNVVMEEDEADTKTETLESEGLPTSTER